MTAHVRLLRSTFLCAAALVAFAACGKKENANVDSATTAVAPADTAPPAPSINDAQIAHIAVTANSIDSAAGVAAKGKARSKAVKDFAQMMVNDHGAVNKQAVALATKLNVTPEDNETSRQLKSSADQSQSALSGMTGAAYDSAYMSHEADYHQAVIDALDKTLIPNAQNAELKALLEQVRPNIVAHLEKARNVLSSLGKK